MRVHAFGWRRFGLLAGTGAVMVLMAVLTAAFAFGDADDPLSGSDTAIILGGTTEPTPDTAFAQAAENLYLHPLGFDDGATSSTVCDMVGTDPCAAPLQVLTTPELIQQGPSSVTDADDVVLAVENELAGECRRFQRPGPADDLRVLPKRHRGVDRHEPTREADGIPSADLHFVFIGDPSLPTGVGPNLVAAVDSVLGPAQADTILTLLGMDSAVEGVTPDDLYPATIYTLDGDGVADFQQDFTAGGLSDALYNFFITHVEYLGLTPTQIADATTSIDGDLTNIDISNNDINNFNAWISAVFEHGAGDDGLLESLLRVSATVFDQHVLSRLVGAPSRRARQSAYRPTQRRTRHRCRVTPPRAA